MTAAGRLSAERHFDRTATLVLSAWSAVSAYGVGGAVFADGVREGRAAIGEVDQGRFPGPFDRAGLVPDFSAAAHLGSKGTRLMDRLTALAVTTVGELVGQCGSELADAPERAALVLGTGWASVQTIVDTTTDSLTGEKPYHVDPARFPNTVMNKAAAQSAIWYTIKGPNTTISGDWLTGLLALSYAVRLYRGGHCDRALVGAVEEYSVQRAWLEWHAASGGPAPVLGEGGVFFLLEPSEAARAAGRVALARVMATRFAAFSEPAGVGRAMADCVRGALDAAGVRAQDVRIVAPSDGPGEAGAQELAAVADVLDGGDTTLLRCRHLIGDTSGARTGFQLAAVLAAAQRGELADGTAALVTGVDRDGTVGCVVLGGHGEPA